MLCNPPPKLNKKLKQICQSIKNRNGFEVYRCINMEEETVFTDTDFRMDMKIRHMSKITSSNVSETRNHIMQLEARVADIQEKTDGVLDEKTKYSIVCSILDAEN